MKSAVILGFFGMFRFSTYSKLGIQNLVLVASNGEELHISGVSKSQMGAYFQSNDMIGFYFQFAAKYHPVAHAFFCSLSDISKF